VLDAWPAVEAAVLRYVELGLHELTAA
jgi:hypothetical protein